MSQESPTGQNLAGADGGERQDLVAGLLAAGLGAAVLLHVQTFPQLPDGQPGPALFPGIVGALFVFFGLTLAVRSVLTRRKVRDTVPTSTTSPTSTMSGRLNALAVLGFVVGYLLVVEMLGFVLTMGGLLFLLMWRLGARPLVAVAASVATTTVMVLIFQRVLLVPLPTGLLLPAGLLG